MNKRLRLLTSIAAFFFAVSGSQVAFGVGLGDITTESKLNEPLVAKIELLSVSALSNRDLIVEIGSRRDYQIAGVERDYFHTDLTLEAYIDGQSRPYISVTSSRPVLEPFVNFVVQVRWPQGKLLREYTILLDLPVFTGRTQEKPVQAPVSEPSQRQQVSSNRRQTANEVSPVPAKPSRPVNVGGEYLVKQGDTLWSMAWGIAVASDTTTQQVILAIRDTNPNAFINGDPNALKAGVVIRVPDESQFSARSKTDAASEYQRIQQRSGRAIEATPVRSSSNNFREQPANRDSSGGRLALTSSAALGAGASNANQGDQTDNRLVDSLENENQILKEELDRTEIENTDLRERVALLEQIVEETNAFLAVEDSELAAVQEGLQQISESADESATDTVQSDDSLVASSSNENEETESVTPPEPAAQPQIVQSEPAPETSFVDSLMGYLPYIGALVVALLLVAVFLMKRRKSSTDDDDLLADDLDSELDDDDEFGDSLDDELESDAQIDSESDFDDVSNETASFVAEDHDEDDGDSLESMDGLFADDEDSDESEQSSEIDEAAEDSLDNVDEHDVEDIDLESALEDLDEFGDLDSFFDEGDIEDFDPDSAGELDDASIEESSESEQDDFSETAIASADEFDIDEDNSEIESAETKEGAESDLEQNAETASSADANEMDFESFDLPEESSEEESLDLHDEEHSMDFDDDLELPAADEDPLDAPKGDDVNSMEFDLDDFDPIGDSEEVEAEESEPAENEMEFDAADIELPDPVEEEPADMHDEAHSMDFDDEIELPSVEDEPVIEEDAENSMEFDVGDLDLPEESSAEDNDDLSGLDLDDDFGSDDDSNDLDELAGDLESDMDDLLSDFGDESESSDEDGFDLSEAVAEDSGASDDGLDLGDGLGGSDLDLDEGLDLADDLLEGLDDTGEDLDEEMNTKLELAEAYVEMVDIRGAKELINEILADGSDAQKEAAQKLSERIEGLD